jgi:nucleotide-binding universal stress UspA family protein
VATSIAGVDTIEAARDAVVVGVDNSSVTRAAVLWAAEEARLRRLNLLIVHIGAKDGHRPDSDAALTRELLLNACAEAASRREPTVIVGTLLLRGQVSEWLVELARSAAMLVLGSEYGRLSSSRKFNGLTDRLTSSGLCDVVTVRRTPKIGDEHPSQVLAVWTSDAARAALLSAAAEEARLRRANLTLALPSPVPAGSVSQTQPWDDHAVAGDLAQLARHFPALQVTIDQIEPSSLAAVSKALMGCHLAVLEYRHTDPAKSRAEDLADALLQEATCPLFFASNHPNASRPRAKAS